MITYIKRLIVTASMALNAIFWVLLLFKALEEPNLMPAALVIIVSMMTVSVVGLGLRSVEFDE